MTSRAGVKVGCVPLKKYPLGLMNNTKLCDALLNGPQEDNDIETIHILKHRQYCKFKEKMKITTQILPLTTERNNEIETSEIIKSDLPNDHVFSSKIMNNIQTSVDANLSNQTTKNILEYKNEMNNLKKLCRICLMSENDLVSIDDFINLIMELVPINVILEKDLPDKICERCLDMLHTSIFFRQLCAASDIKLKTIIQKYNNESKIFDSKKLNVTSSYISISLKDNEKNKVNYSKAVINNHSDVSVQTEDLTKTKPHLDCNVEQPLINGPNENLPFALQTGLRKPNENEHNNIKLKMDGDLKTLKFENYWANIDNIRMEIKIEQDEALKNFEQNPNSVTSEIRKDDPKLSANSLQTHGKNYSDEKSLKCNVCLKKFSRTGDLNRHKKLHTSERPFQCNVCPKAFICLSYLKQHERSHTGEKAHLCDICTKAFNCLSKLKQHKRSHTGEKPYLCDICSKTFFSSTSLKLHKRSHTGEKPFQCNTCFRTFARATVLRNHERTHTGERPFQCSICSKTFVQLITLKVHERIHTGERPFHCNTCSKTFRDVSNLTQHIKNHTGERPFQCNICFKTFSQLGSLRTHKINHTGIKPFRCKTCFKTFTNLENLRGHERAHTGERPYRCNTCFKTFTRSKTLNQHKKVHKTES